LFRLCGLLLFSIFSMNPSASSDDVLANLCQADVLDAAKALELNISQVCGTYLRELVMQEQKRRWRSDHADFIAAYNATIDTEGLPLDQWRTF